MTVAWDGCAIANQGAAPTSVAVDFDLFLYGPLGPDPKYVWASQSFDDNNEGLDYTIPYGSPYGGQEGTYQLILMWPEGATSCECLESPCAPGAPMLEPIVSALVVL